MAVRQQAGSTLTSLAKFGSMIQGSRTIGEGGAGEPEFVRTTNQELSQQGRAKRLLKRKLKQK